MVNIEELKSKAESLLERVHLLTGRRLLVVGDLGLDEYVMGKVRRISQEAPVPVVETYKEEVGLGMAANVALNISQLGGESHLIAVVGEDAAALRLRNLLRDKSVPRHSLIADSGGTSSRGSHRL